MEIVAASVQSCAARRPSQISRQAKLTVLPFMAVIPAMGLKRTRLDLIEYDVYHFRQAEIINF